ncbi:hypothetical protein GCM10010459_15910 [Microbacterium schleiferi]
MPGSALTSLVPIACPFHRIRTVEQKYYQLSTRKSDHPNRMPNLEASYKRETQYRPT